MNNGRQWFKENFKDDGNKICTSKFYKPEESWPKTQVWWLQFSETAIDAIKYAHVYLPGCSKSRNFHYLQVPVKYLNDHLDKFHRLGQKIDLYLSANPDTLFVEERGEGRLNFSKFLVEKGL
ncbi:MAG: hypothetical protein M3Z26_11890 [Bacteroidota bacterium]|nr:hypothetical protein [Bacteroidota bacterium]